MIFASKCHDLQLRTSILARFVASGAAGRAAAGKILKRGLKWYLLGPSGQKNNLKGVLGTKGRQNGPFGGKTGVSSLGSPAGKSAYISVMFLSIIKKLIQFQHVGHLHVAF